MVEQPLQIPTNAKFPEVWRLLRPYQVVEAKKMIRRKKWLNYLDMGLGKTLITALAVMELEAFPCLIVCPKPATYVWEGELQKWFGEASTVYTGKPHQREKLFEEFVEKGHKFIITNYALAEEVAARFGIKTAKSKEGSSTRGNRKEIPPHPGTKPLQGVIADEIHDAGLFNHKTKAWKLFKKLSGEASTMFLLTGTPYRKGAVDFFGPLSLVDGATFSSYWGYVHKWCITIQTPFGKSIERNPKNIVAFRRMLRNYASILKKEDYLHELPGKQRQAVPLEMTPEQRRVYEEIAEQMMAETDSGELVITPGILSQALRQRQLLVCPQELGLKTRGAAIDALVDMSSGLVAEGKPFVVFTPFRSAIKWIAEALLQAYPQIEIFKLMGGMPQRQFAEQWQRFQEYDKQVSKIYRRPRVLLCVIHSGASFQATAADTAFFLGYDWDFNKNVQAEDRLNRMGQKNAVTCYYMLHKGTIDEHVISVLNEKQFAGDLVLSNDEDFRKMLLRGKRDA